MCYPLFDRFTSSNACAARLHDVKCACLCVFVRQGGYLCTCLSASLLVACHTTSCDTATTHAWLHAQCRRDTATLRQRFSRSAWTEPHVVSLWGCKHGVYQTQNCELDEWIYVQVYVVNLYVQSQGWVFVDVCVCVYLFVCVCVCVCICMCVCSSSGRGDH